MKMTTEAAARDVAVSLPGIPLGDLGLLIGELVGLLEGCFPDPTPEQIQEKPSIDPQASAKEAAKYLNNPPSWGLFGLRYKLWERSIKNATAKAWKGNPAVVGLVQDAVLKRIKMGVPVTSLIRLKMERK